VGRIVKCQVIPTLTDSRDNIEAYAKYNGTPLTALWANERPSSHRTKEIVNNDRPEQSNYISTRVLRANEK
jgi:hypothetical protein